MKQLFPLFFVLAFFKIQAQDTFKKTVLDVKDNGDYSSFSLLPPDTLKNYNLFFTGEDHRYRKSNSDIELKMFKYLHKNAGVRAFIQEFGYSLGFIANKYVQTGDTVAKKILKKFTYKEYYNLYENLREYYVSLPDDEKFEILAVDIERDLLYPSKMLQYILPKADPEDDSIRLSVEAIKAAAEFFDDRAERERKYWDDDEEGENVKTPFDTAYDKARINAFTTLSAVIENFARHKEKYKEYLGADYALFAAEIRRLEEFYTWREWSGMAQEYLFRENKMEENLENVFNERAGLKAYGQFGRCHTQRERDQADCFYYYFTALATRLNNSKHPAFNGKVFSCPMYYPASFRFMDDNVPINKGLKPLISEAEKNKITLFIPDTADARFASLNNRFNAIIINYLLVDKSTDSLDRPRKRNYDYEYEARMTLLVESGINGYNISNLNNALGTNFTDIPQFVGFSFGFTENHGAYSSTAFHWYSPTEQKINDSTRISLKGFRLVTRFGGDVIKSSAVDLNIFGGYGYERWVLQSIEKFSNESNRDIFGNDRIEQYTNPALILTAGFDFRVHARFVTFGIFGGYQLDVSRKQWRRNNALIESTPRFSLNSYTVGGSIGFNIGLY